MDKSKNKMSMFENLRGNSHGYSIEIGSTTFEDTLEDRIQAAKAASARNQSQKAKGKLSVSNVPDFIKRNKQNIIPQVHNSQNLLKSPCKGGGFMQRRLEAIKSSKKFSNVTSFEPYTSNTKEPFKFSKNVSSQTLFNNHDYNQIDTNHSKPNEYNTRSSVRKHPISEIDHHHSTLIGPYTKNVTSTPNCSNNSVTSVQNRLIKVKEDMKAKSKLLVQNDIAKTEMTKNLPASESINPQDKRNNNLRSKTKRLTTSNESCKRTLSPFSKIKLNKPNFSKIIENQELVTVQPIKPNHILSNPSETIVSSKSENQNICKKPKLLESDSFKFVTPKTFSVQQRLENIKKIPNNFNIQSNNDNSMEWEDVEPNNIVDTVNDLRRTHDYEPMEWMPDIPDTVMYCDRINYCFVLDTNVLLLDLKSISLALDSNFREYGYVSFVLPWQVFQELDYIKKRDDQLGYRAREATRWMLDKFSSKHPRLKGQPMTNKESGNNDDAILKCAIHLQTRVNHISLITDDHILTIKSEINGISAKNSTWLKKLVSTPDAEIKESDAKIKESNIFQEAVKKYPVIDNNLIMKFEPHLEHIIGKVLKRAVKQNKSLPSFSKTVWWKVYELTPPLNLMKCLSKLKECWNIIAPQNTLKCPTNQLDWLLCFLKDLQLTSPEINLSWNELYDFLKYCSEIITALPNEYVHITDALLNDLMTSGKCLKQNLSGTILNESLEINQLDTLNVSSDYDLNVDIILHNILKEVESFCSYVYEVYDFHRDPTENKLNGLHPKTECFKKTIENYCCKLFKIIKIMLKIKKYKTDQILESHIIIKEFLEAIVEFDYQEYHKLKEKNVIDYCLMKDKNSFLSTLVYLQNNLAAVKNLVTIVKP